MSQGYLEFAFKTIKQTVFGSMLAFSLMIPRKIFAAKVKSELYRLYGVYKKRLVHFTKIYFINNNTKAKINNLISKFRQWRYPSLAILTYKMGVSEMSWKCLLRRRFSVCRVRISRAQK